MTLRIQFPRFSGEDYNGYTGAIGEITYDTETNSIVSHDGVLEGGRALVNKKVQFDLELTHDGGDFRLVDRNNRTLLDGRGRYPVVYPFSRGTSGDASSDKLIDALPPTNSGHDQYVVTLGHESVADGWGSVYYADQGDIEAPAIPTYAKIPIQGNAANGHWKIVPLAPNPVQISVWGRINDMDIATPSSGRRIFTVPDKLDRLVITDIDFLVKDDGGGGIPTDTVYALGRFVDGNFQEDETFVLPVAGNYLNDNVFTVSLLRRRAYANNDAALYLEVSSASSGGSSVQGDVIFRGYYVEY